MKTQFWNSFHKKAAASPFPIPEKGMTPERAPQSEENQENLDLPGKQNEEAKRVPGDKTFF